MKQVYCKEGTLCSKYPLEKRKIIKKSISKCMGWFLAVILIGITLLPSYRIYKEYNKEDIKLMKEIFPFLWETMELEFRIFFLFLSVIIFIFILTLVYEIFYFKFYFYDMTEKELIIRKGVLARREVTIPFSRIQDVYVDQDILDRIFGLYDVHIATAATAVYGSERAHIDGVNFENAQALKNLIIEKIRKESPKTGV